MSKLTERQRLVVTIAVSVVLTGVLLFLVFSDRGEIEKIEEEIGALDTRLQAADIERRKIPAREDAVLTFRAVESRELAVLPTEQRISDFHRNLSTFLSAAGVGFTELPESSPEDSELAKGIRVTRNKLKGRGEATSILKFLNLIENDPRLVAVKGFKMQAGDLDRDNPNATVLHEFEVELETYFYRPSKGSIKREHIPGAEERIQDPKLKAAIAEFQPERPDTYVLRPAVGRRDPLVDPRRAREKVDPEERERQWNREEEIVVDLETRYREIAEKIEMEKALIAKKDWFRAERAKVEINKLIGELRTMLEHTAHTKSVQLPELAARVGIVSENLKRTRSMRPDEELVVTLAVCQGVLEDLRQKLATNEYADMHNLGTTWNSFLRGKPITPEAQPVLAEIKGMLEKGKTLGEFEGMTFNITGVIVDHSQPKRSLAVINGAYVRAGDRLDEEGLVQVERVGTASVHFRYKGLVIEVETGKDKEKESAKASGKTKKKDL